MEKRFYILITVSLLTLLLSSCELIGGMTPESLQLDKAYSFNAEIKYGSAETAETVTGSFTRGGVKAWSGTINEPYALQGIQVSYSDGIIGLSCGDISLEPSERGDSALMLMLDALESGITDSGASIKTAGAGIEISGTNQNGLYILTVDRGTGLPASLSVPSHKLDVVFTDVSVSENGNGTIAVDFNDFADSGFAG